MQFSDLDKKVKMKHRDAAVYENTRISNVSLDSINELGATDLQTTGGDYEELRFDTKQNERKSVKVENKRDTFQWKDQPKEIKYIVYSLSVMLVILYIIVTIVVVVISLPKGETDGLWTHWSPWSNCDVTCNNGTQTRTRLCTNPSTSNGQPDCFGDSTDARNCQKDSCDADGLWTHWSPWSNCDVTCNNGTQTRTRLCTNPSKSNGQPDCSGDSTDTRNCQKDSCDDGVWSNWESWGSCSDSCGGGIKSRFRTCTNSGPSTHGKGCEGSSEQVVLCNKNTCDDSAWSSWGNWGSCSESCGGGVKSRLRTCTNPRPSILWKECVGSSQQVVMCNKYTCGDGAWSSWGNWGSCSENCGGGVKSRLRTCTNPRPSLLGKGCEGSSEQVVLCNKNTCYDHKVVFLAYGSSKETTNTVIKFPRTLLNYGNGYSSSTGRFTCKIAGIYNFAVTLTKPRRDIDQTNAYLRRNGINQLQLHTDPDDHDNVDYGSYSLSVTANFHLNTHDYVDVYSIPNNFINDLKTSFTGVLVIPDN